MEIGKCLMCSKQIVSDNGLCEKCFRKFEVFQAERKRILNNFRVRKHRMLKGDTEEDGFSTPLAMTEKEAIKELEREKRKELAKLQRKHTPTPSPDRFDSTFIAYEKWLSLHNGDTWLWAKQHGYKPDSLKSEFVEFKYGKLQHNSNICQKCGKTKQFCRCNQQQQGEFNFNFRT